jgi:hypothetical protein
MDIVIAEKIGAQPSAPTDRPCRSDGMVVDLLTQRPVIASAANVAAIGAPMTAGAAFLQRRFAAPANLNPGGGAPGRKEAAVFPPHYLKHIPR